MDWLNDTPFAVGHLTWQLRPPQPSLTLVVKATYALVPNGTCTPVDEPDLCTGDLHYDDEPEQSIRHPSDLVVYKPRGECFLVGTCHPPGGRAMVSAVAFEVGPVRKAMAVLGDRVWRGVIGKVASDPEPFESMPLRWERSFGGPSHRENPWGRGLSESDDGHHRLANLEDPEDLVSGPGDRPRPAGAFPLPYTAASRSGRAGTFDARWVEQRWPWYPQDADLHFLLAAPEDQWLAEATYFRGDETIALRNLRPDAPLVRTQLPGHRPRAFLGRAARPEGLDEIPLSLDTVVVDADRALVLCVWRGITEVESERLDGVPLAYVGVEQLGDDSPASRWEARVRELLAEAERAEAELEGEAPVDEPTVEAPAAAAPPAAGDDGGLAAKVAELDAMLAAHGLVAPEGQPPPPPPTPESLRAMRDAMLAAGLEPPAALDEVAAMMEAPEPPPGEPPAATSEPSKRELVDAALARGESLAGWDLDDADLADLDLSGCDLTGAMLRNARLANANLSRARLDEAQLGGADLTRAVLVDASLVAADLTGVSAERLWVERSKLSLATLTEARLVGSTWAAAELDGAMLQSADLREARLRSVKLDGADLNGATLEAAELVDCTLVDAYFEGARASGIRFERCDLTLLRADEGADLRRASMRSSRAPGARFSGSCLDEADLGDSDLSGADFTDASLVATNLDECELRRGRFARARCVGLLARKANLFEASFEEADLSHADLRGATLFGAGFWRAKTGGARLELADLGRTLLEGR